MIRKRYLWKLKRREISLGERTLIMGVLNVTPDSFSDGGHYLDPDRAFARALELEDEGADILDVGAESTRPGSKRLSEQEELQRLVPVLRRLRGKLAIPISVDTYKSAVAERALELEAEIINDPSGTTFDPRIVKVVREHDGGVVLNHMRGTPETWSRLGPLPDVIAAIGHDLDAAVNRALQGGIRKERIILDPGLGFGKRGDQNYEILARLTELAVGFPLLVGPSRKSFLSATADDDRLMATAATVTAAILGGAHVVRVHDVRQMVPAIRAADAVLAARENAIREREIKRDRAPRRTEAPDPRGEPRDRRPKRGEIS